MWTGLAIIAGLAGCYAVSQNPAVGVMWLAIAGFAYTRRPPQQSQGCKSRLRGCEILVIVGFVGLVVYAMGYSSRTRSTVSPTAQSVAVQSSTATRTPLPRPTVTEISNTKTNTIRATVVATSTPSVDILQVTSGGVQLTLREVEFINGVGGDEASNGILAVFLGEFRTDSRYCVHARDIRLILDDVAYAPDRRWMRAVQETLSIRRDYPGPINGHCVDPNEDMPTFFVFDVPAAADSVQLGFIDKTLDVPIGWGVLVANIVSATPLPSDTKTATQTRTVVTPTIAPPTVQPTRALFTPQAGVIMTTEPVTYYAISSANVRACASTDCDIVTRLSAGNAITVDASINGESVDAGNAVWYHIRYNRYKGYIYSNLVSLVRPSTKESGSGNPLPTSAQNTPERLVSTPTSNAPVWSCAGDIYNCGDFSNRTDLMSYFNACPGDPSKLDNDNDGIPCESL